MSRPVNSVGASISCWLFVAVLAAGVIASLAASTRVLAAGTAGMFPWSIMPVLNVVFGLAVASGAFAIALSAYIVPNETWRQVARPSLIIGCAAYIVAMLGSLEPLKPNLGLVRDIVSYPTGNSPIIGGVWVTAAMALWLFAEFSPSGMQRHLRRATLLTMAPLLTGIAQWQQWRIAARLTQLGSAQAPQWGGPQVALLFVVSSVALGTALVLLATIRFDARRESAAILTRVCAALLLLYLILRLNDVAEREVLRYTFEPSTAMYFWPEIALVFAAIVWLADPGASARTLYAGSAMAVLGIVAHRLNSCISAFEITTHTRYRPYWAETTVAYSVLAVGLAFYVLVTKWVDAQHAPRQT